MPDNDVSEYLTVMAAAKEMECSEGRVRQFLAEGRLVDCIRKGHIWLIPRWEIKRFQEIPRINGGTRKKPYSTGVVTNYKTARIPLGLLGKH